MKAKVNRDACISCGACEAICEEVFELDDEGISVVKEETIKEEQKDAVLEARDTCPTGAIEVEEDK